uniref:Lipid-binding serum glycoprotein C-terminal domain-containing protein n=1 Tax=Parascaris univalens TaxID=6257 RepID=A0A915AY76_PARUN
MCLRWLIFVSLACITSQQSTIRVRLTNKGLHFFSDEGHHILEHEVRKIDFPQISFPITRGPGTGIVNVTNLKIGQFTSPNIQLKLAPPNGIGWKTEGGSVKLVGDWQAVYKLLVPADIDVDGRRPQLNIGACSMDVQGVDVIVGGGVLPWIVNLFRPELSALVREEIRSQLCITLQTVLLEKVNEILHSLPTHIQIANNFFLNYRCEEKPLSTNSFIEGEMYSDIVYENTTCDLPIRYMDHEVGRAKYMTHIWVSDHIPNCLLLSAHSASLLNFIIDKNFDKGKFKSLLSTSCSFISLCIGRFFPILREHYPNEFVDLRFNTADTPNVAIVPSGVSINVLLDVDLFISPWTEHKDALARLAANISFDVLPSILNKSLTGTIENVTVVIVEVKSIIGHLNQRFIAILETLTRDAIEVLAISALRVGIHLPLVDNVTLADDAHIVSGQGFIRIDSDFIYQ